MHSLYVDSTSGLVVGLLDSSLNWLEYKDTAEKKPSEVIHVEIYNLVKKYQLNFQDINFIFSSGPGSYTGMRLGEGIAQVLDWDLLKVFSFFHFDVPRFAGVSRGFWVTNAFKGQVFIYKWDVDKNLFEKSLINNNDFSIIDSKLGYTLDSSGNIFESLKSTKDLIKNESQKIFSIVLQNKLREPPFYFRTLEEEFK